MDAADELTALVLDRLTVLEAINQNTRECDRPINAAPIQRWIDDLKQRVIRANLKAITVPDNPLLSAPVCNCPPSTAAGLVLECPIHDATNEGNRMDKLAEVQRLLDEVNRELPKGFNFEFAVVELPTMRTNSKGEHAWQAYEDQFVTSDGQNAYIDGEELSPVEIADGLGAALIAANRHHAQ